MKMVMSRTGWVDGQVPPSCVPTGYETWSLKLALVASTAIPARREQDLDANAVGAVALWERVRLWDGRLVEAEAMVVEGLVRGIRAHRASGGRAGDHAETLGELLNVGFGATMQVVDGPV
jgi:hypothetical protein